MPGEEPDRTEGTSPGSHHPPPLCVYIPATMLSAKPASKTRTRHPYLLFYWNQEITMWFPGKCGVCSWPASSPRHWPAVHLASFLSRKVLRVCVWSEWAGEGLRLSGRHLGLAAFVRVSEWPWMDSCRISLSKLLVRHSLLTGMWKTSFKIFWKGV